MRATSQPPIPYARTAQRPQWAELPAVLREAISARLGAPVTAAHTVGGGFTPGFVGVVETATGERSFIKSALRPDQDVIADFYATEATVSARLPAALPAARLRWTLNTPSYVVLCFDAIDGQMPEPPWQPAALDTALDTWARAAAVLAAPPPELVALRLPRLIDHVPVILQQWTAVAHGTAPSAAMPDWALAQLPALTALEAKASRYLDADTLTHLDLRADNVIIDSTGRGWICDWNWLCHGPAWFDTVGMLVGAYAGGHDTDRLFAEHPTSQGAPSDALDVALAAFAGYWLEHACRPGHPGSPHIRPHQRWHGEQALAWLATRQGWPTPTST